MSRRERWAYAAIFIVLALVAIQCVRLGMAGLLVQTGQNEVDRLALARRTPTLGEIDRTLAYFLQGLDYAANNPWALEGAGALNLAKMRATRVPGVAVGAARDARSHFRLALQQRPTSPFLWANLALTKLYLDEIDAELKTALRHADELGPWEPTVQQTILFVGLAVWPDLDPGLRQALAQSVSRGTVHDSVKMFEIAKSYARFDLVCAIDKYRSIAGPDCDKAADAVRSDKPKLQGRRR